MSEAAKLLVVEFLSWISSRRRTYAQAMNAWQSTCPRRTIREDAIIDGYIELKREDALDDPRVALTPRGQARLDASTAPRAPSCASD
jgi:hypothetical protein